MREVVNVFKEIIKDFFNIIIILVVVIFFHTKRLFRNGQFIHIFI